MLRTACDLDTDTQPGFLLFCRQVGLIGGDLCADLESGDLLLSRDASLFELDTVVLFCGLDSQFLLLYFSKGHKTH